MSPPLRAGATREGSGRTEIVLAPGQRERIQALGMTVSELVRYLLDLALEDLDGTEGADDDGEPLTVGERVRRLRPHGLTAIGRTTMIARCRLGDDAALAAAQAAVPEDWSARSTVSGRVTVVARPNRVWRMLGER